METILTSPTKTVKIGPEQPFVIIGERINPTGRKKLAAEMAAWNFERVKADALAQVQAGARMLDVNAGIPLADEPAIMAEAIRLVQDTVDVPLSIDSSIVKALESGLKAYRGKPLVNSVTGEDERLEAVLPLVAQYGAAVIGITNDETGISEDPDVRFGIARKIVERAASYGIPHEDVLIDPLAMPIGAVRTAGTALFRLVQRVRDELGCNTVCGASNISFGLPDRPTLNATFLAMAIAAGMTSAITNPLEETTRKTVLAADVFMAHDENCMNWLKYTRMAERAAAAAAAASAEAAGLGAAGGSPGPDARGAGGEDLAERRRRRRESRGE
jgi:5-methyltetrahydrofolate--homocysteine methyltransferase